MATAAKHPITQTDKIEQAIDRQKAGALAINQSSGGLNFQSVGEVLEFAKLMAVSGQAVPPHCRNAPGICLGILIQSIEWRMSPYAVASKSYVVNDRIAWESQLIHAVIEQRAPITGRLRHEFLGQDKSRQCRVWSTARGEDEPLSYTSPTFETIQPKNSPLWKTKPDLQLYYNASRDWARMYFPDVIMGVYADDEMQPLTVEAPASVTRQLPPPKTRVEQLSDQVSGFAATADSGPVSADDLANPKLATSTAAVTPTIETTEQAATQPAEEPAPAAPNPLLDEAQLAFEEVESIINCRALETKWLGKVSAGEKSKISALAHAATARIRGGRGEASNK